MTTEGRRSTFEEIRKRHHITRSQIARSAGMSVDDVRVLEETGRRTEATWLAAIQALNTLATTNYQPADFTGLVITNWPVIQVE